MKKVFAKKSRIKGMGAYAGEAIKKGEIIMRFTGKRMSVSEIEKVCERGLLRWDDPFQIGKYSYLLLDTMPNCLNHSCAPNAGIRGKTTLVAIKPIRAGEELTYDYSTLVSSTDPGYEPWYMLCRCGAKQCRKRVGNWETLPKARLRLYLRERVVPDCILKQVEKTKTAP